MDAWTDEVITHKDGRHELQDKYSGEDIMKTVHDKKYLGDIISDDMINCKNIKEKTNRGVGIVRKILTSIIERPYGKHTYKAAKLMREGMHLGTMLTNAESWINITKKDIKALEKPDTFLQRSILTQSGNPCKVFMNLELGILPIKYVILEKRLKFLRYILNENKTSMIRKVYDELKKDSRKGDFIDLVVKDMEDIGIDLSEEEIQCSSKLEWKKYV